MTTMSVSRFERLFKRAASLDVDKEDLRRYNDFVNDLLLIGEAHARD